jgi:hypothetical protein
VLGVGGVVALVLALNSFDSGLPTGPVSDEKEASGPVAALGIPQGRRALMEWTEDEAVAQLVDAPVKVMGSRAFSPGARITLKGLMDDAEARIRALYASGPDESTLREALESIASDYTAALEGLSAAR